ncbi:MAG: ribonuclease E/G, partial [Betaproteobacteria bacterium]
GLIVIDFIDMEESRNRREVESRLRDALRQDRARVQFGTISKFGLMEMSRQRLRPALSEGASIPCPRCGGSGHIRDTESSALQILRIIQEESLKDNTASVLCQVPVEVASFLLNEKRTEIAKIELKQRINVLMVPNKTLETPNYKLERLKHDDPRLDHIEASYKMADDMEEATGVTRRSQEPTNKQTPIIKGVLPDAPAPQAPVKVEAPRPVPVAVQAPAAVAAAAPTGLFGWIKGLLGAPSATPAAPAAIAPAKTEERRDGRAPREGGREGGRDGNRGGRGGRGGEGRGPRADGRGEGRGEARGESRNGRGGRGGERTERGGERSLQRDRFDAENKGANPEMDAVSLIGDAEAPRQERAPRGERGGRGRNGERSNERMDGGERHERSTEPTAEAGNGEAAVSEREPREGRSRGGRGRRNDRGPRTDDGSSDAHGVAAPEASGNAEAAPEGGTDQGQEGREPGQRRSRDRYGRDRGGRSERSERAAPADHNTADLAQGHEPAQAEHVVRASYFTQAPATGATPAAVDAAAHAEPAVSEPQEVLAQNVAAPSIAAARAEPLAATATDALPGVPQEAAMPKVHGFDLPVDNLHAVAQTSGLQWVNSDPARVAAVQAAIAAEAAPARVVRERPAPVIVQESALVLVETKRDLRALEVPMDSAPKTPV